jgi:hypothetical protein
MMPALWEWKKFENRKPNKRRLQNAMTTIEKTGARGGLA